MTNKEALQSVISYEVENELLEKQLLDCGIVSSDTYTASNHNEIELCSAYIYRILATSPDFRQGSLAISNTKSKEFLNLANFIFAKYGKIKEIQNLTIKGQII